MDYNFHTHTIRCRHASGSDEDYIKCAIEAGIKHLGFSDHAPFVFPDGYENRYRMPMLDGEGYVKDLRLLRKKYKDKIDIHIGLEMEYYPVYFEEMLKIARNIQAEYLILGQHFIMNEHPNGIGSVGPTDSVQHLKTYVDEVICAMESGLFSFVAHPDLVIFVGDDSIYDSEITRLSLASKELDVPLEINLAGIRGKKHYPSERFWQIVGRVGAPVTIGYDAHACEDFLGKEQLSTAKELIQRYRLNYIGMPKIRNINL